MSNKPSAPDKAVCQYCGQEFLRYYANRQYCCSACKQRARNKRRYAMRRSSKREYRPTAAMPPPKRPAINAVGLLRAERRDEAVAAAKKRCAMMERLAERDRAFAEWAGESGKPRRREFRPADIYGISTNDMRRWY